MVQTKQKEQDSIQINGDDVPDKLKRTLNALAKKFEITYQGLADD